VAAGGFGGEGGLELFQQLSLFGGEVDRGFDHDLAIEIARGVAADGFDAFAAQAEEFSGLGFSRFPPGCGFRLRRPESGR